jgi:hypothetical protein
MMLRDAPDGAEFIDRCVAAAADMALAFVGEPIDTVMRRLNQTHENLRRDLTPQFGPEVAHQVADAFVRAVIGQKAQLDAGIG